MPTYDNYKAMFLNYGDNYETALGEIQDYDDPDGDWGMQIIGEWGSYPTLKSAPSVPINNLSIPPPLQLDVTFVYNFWQADEVSNDTGVMSEAIHTHDIFEFDDDGEPIMPQEGMASTGGSAPLDIEPNQVTAGEFIRAGTIVAQVPRWIEISWLPSELHIALNAEHQFGSMPSGDAANFWGTSLQLEKEIADRLQARTMLDQTAMMNSLYNSAPFVDVAFQDCDLSRQLRGYIEAIISIIGEDNISTTGLFGGTSWDLSGFMAVVRDHFKKFNIVGLTGHDFGIENAFVNKPGQTTYVDSLFRAGTMGSAPDPSASPVTYRPGTGDYAGGFDQALDRVELSGLFNGKFIGDIVSRMANNPWGPFSDTISLDEPWADNFQSAVRSDPKATQFNENEYNVMMPILYALAAGEGIEKYESENSDDPTVFENFMDNMIVAGYVIEKYEVGYVSSNSALPIYEKHSPIIIGGGGVSSAIDTKIKVGATYFYRPRTVVKMTLNIPVPDDSHVYKVPMMMISSAGPGKLVHAMNDVVHAPPPPPGDIRFVWDYTNEWLTMHWAFPVTTQRDIKYFKIFRRASVEEPYQLMALYDFNVTDPCIYAQIDLIRPSLRQKVEKTWYRDIEFSKGSAFIYCLISVDARGVSSNYSEQFAVSWDAKLNKLRIEALSPPHAPEPYPNFFLRESLSSRFGQTELTTDLIKSSRRKKAYVFLEQSNPLQLYIPGQAPSPTILWDKDAVLPPGWPKSTGKYVMSIANLDMHKQQIVSFKMMGTEYSPGEENS